MNYHIFILFIVLLAITIVCMGCNRVVESFQIKETTLPIPEDKVIPIGFYQIDSSTMTQLPENDFVSPVPNLSQGFNIPNGYYSVMIDGTTWIAKVPDGFIANANKDGITPIANMLSYDSNRYDIQYHDSIEDIIAQGGIYDLSFGSMVVVDAAGKKVYVPYVPGRALPIYNVPGSFVYGPSTYVPNYADSIYLSRSTGMSTVSTAVPVSSQLGGFCEHSKTNTTEIEQHCNRLPTDVCASTKCCVLLGGHKCVAGDEKGPTLKANYTDPLIRNKDLYYYQGKCYGNCG